jgi:hypothetical protein
LEWPSLGAGVCSNVLIPPAAPDKIDGIVAEAQQVNGADVIAKLSADPVGTAYSVLADG